MFVRSLLPIFVFVNKEMKNAEGSIDKDGKCY